MSPVSADDDLVEEILAGVASLLARHGSSLVKEGVMEPGFVVQARSIITETVGRCRSDDATVLDVSVEYADDASLLAHGAAAGMREIGPAEPLMAAELLFHYALPALVAYLRADAEVTTVALVLHNAIWRRFPPGALAYVQVLRNRLASAFADSRASFARDLHDRVAGSLLVARQRLELAERNGDSDAVRMALDALDTCVDEVRSLASGLRRVDGPDDLEVVISNFARSLRGGPVVEVSREGAQRPLSALTTGEAAAIVMECVRNAWRHATGATVIGVRIVWGRLELSIAVSDDGDSLLESPRAGLGLVGMTERAGSIGASLELLRDRGTVVKLRVPYQLQTIA